jgi:DNA-directed RNA polymerase specialized sigma24 family protein
MNDNDDLKGLTDRLKSAKTPEEKDALWLLLFPRLRKVAQNRISARGRSGQDSPTELVNELYPGLQKALDSPRTHFKSRAHFFAYAAFSMRRHLAAQARRQMVQELLDENFSVESGSPAISIALNEALDKLSKRLPRAVQAFELREYAGHSYEEILELMTEYKTKALLAADLTMIRKLLVEMLGEA